ncbi:MAG: prolyl oligopeptidase family serine peptidase, partial [Acidimicrobiia bacterium]|nr:prolyl oligopeptidase family serine peptidase [Acidimicrobiia bacterium]
RESASGIVSYSVDAAGTKACFTLAGALFVLDLLTHDVSTPLVEGPVFDPRLSPDGRYVAYVSAGPQSENALRMVDLTRPGSDRVLAHSPDPLVSFGKADFIAAEEMQRQRGFWWSPDSDALVVTRVDETPVDQWWVHDPAHPDKAPTELRYPAAGTINSDVDLYLIDISDLPDLRSDDPEPKLQRVFWSDRGAYEYLADVVWSKGHAPLVVRQTRDQLEVSIAALDLDTLKLSERRRIQEDTWVELIPSSPTPCEHGLLTIEDLAPLHRPGVPDSHPGCRALMLDGRALTDEAVQVQSIVGVVDRHALISAWTEPTEIHLFLVDLTSGGSGKRPAPIPLTNNAGVHSASLGVRPSNSDGAAESDDQEPLAVVAVSTTRPTSDGVEIAIRPLIEPEAENGSRPHPVLGNPIGFIDDLSIRPPIKATPLFYKLGADRLESALFFPTDYEGNEPLPVLLDPYGGPHAQRVLKTHNSHLVSQWFADQGYAVLVTDGRGTPGRGPRWERQVWGDLAKPVLEDQLAALDDAATEFGFLDLDRVGIRGWSFGGYLAALAVLRRPDRFHAAIAGAPVTTWSLYDTHYTERYLGHPGMYPQHYLDTDLTAEAHKLVRPLLLIHGLVDDNVVAAHTLRMSTALLAAGVPHQVLPLSGVTHMTPQQSVAENLLRLQLDFLRTSLEDVTPVDPMG